MTMMMMDGWVRRAGLLASIIGHGDTTPQTRVTQGMTREAVLTQR